LRSKADWLKKNPHRRVILEGHADERGTDAYNLILGDKRAVAVRDYLVENGVDSARLRIVDYGKARPAVAAHNEAAWRQNRRVVIVAEP
jgi:peptidoglycan-associated lipoprotein